MKIAAYIPARYNSQRFPGKLLKDLAGKPVILRTYEAALQTGLFQEVVVITDDERIYKLIKQNDGKALISNKQHATGTDRIAEFASETDAEIIVNIQGDEPFINKKALADLIGVFVADKLQKIDIASLMIPIENKADFLNPNNVKVVTNTRGEALFFSRAPIPYSRDKVFEKAFKHIGVYAFRKHVLEMIAKQPQTELENIEKLENLRFLEAGFTIQMIETHTVNFGIDTEEDLQKAIQYLKKQDHA